MGMYRILLGSKVVIAHGDEKQDIQQSNGLLCLRNSSTWNLFIFFPKPSHNDNE